MDGQKPNVPDEVREIREMMRAGCRSPYYVLGGPNGETPVSATLFEMAAQLENDAMRRVALTTIPGGYVSTVFTFMDVGCGGSGPPVLFETMVFGGPLDGHQLRYHTYTEAEAGHAAVVAEVRAHHSRAGWHWGRLREWARGIPDAIARRLRKAA